MFKYFVVLAVLSIAGCTPGSSATEKKAVLADSTDFFTLHVEFPEDIRDSALIMQAFSHQLFKEKQEEWKVGGEMYLEEQKINAEFPDRAAMRYVLHQDFEKFEDDSLKTVSYLFSTYEYTGGANGNVYCRTFVFTNDKKVVDIQDILDFSNYQDIALTKILAAKALSDTTLFFKDFVESGLGITYLKDDGVTLDQAKCQCDGFFFGSNFQNFVLGKEGITFYFPKYGIAPGVAGITKVHLTWAELKPYLKSPLPF